jgi:hypothetical protein
MEGNNMPTSWKRADDNALRAHLQEALAQRAATADAGDWSYSDYEIAAIRAELDERQLAQDTLRDHADSARLAKPSPGAEGESRIEPTDVDPEVARLRVLISRCFSPARRHGGHGAREDSDLPAPSLYDGHRFVGKAPTPVFARLQRLR